MPELVSIDEQQGIITVISQGNVVFQDFAKAIEEIISLHEKTGIDRVLVDASARKEVMEKPTAARGAEFLARKTASRLRFAIVGSEFKDHQKIFQTTAGMNFGLVRYFIDKKEALDWLNNI